MFCFMSLQPHPCQPGAKLTWSKSCADLPVAMYHAHTVVMKDLVYTGGGCSREQDANTVFRYDLTLETWDHLPPCPVSSFGLAKYFDKVLAIGGITSAKGISNAVYDFDEQSQKWESTIPPMLTARHSLTAVSYLNSLIACGGNDANGVSNAVEVFKPGTSQWYKSSPLPFPCYHMSSTIIHGSCYMLGGFDQHAFTDKVLCAQIADLLEPPALATTSNPKNKSHWYHFRTVRYTCTAAANLGGCLLSIGGRAAKVYMYSQMKNTWSKLTDLPKDGAYLGPAVAELPTGELLLIGGATSKLEPQSTVYKGIISY